MSIGSRFTGNTGATGEEGGDYRLRLEVPRAASPRRPRRATGSHAAPPIAWSPTTSRTSSPGTPTTAAGTDQLARPSCMNAVVIAVFMPWMAGGLAPGPVGWPATSSWLPSIGPPWPPVGSRGAPVPPLSMTPAGDPPPVEPLLVGGCPPAPGTGTGDGVGVGTGVPDGSGLEPGTAVGSDDGTALSV